MQINLDWPCKNLERAKKSKLRYRAMIDDRIFSFGPNWKLIM